MDGDDEVLLRLLLEIVYTQNILFLRLCAESVVE